MSAPGTEAHANDPREDALYAAGWQRLDGRWWPPSGVHIGRAPLSGRAGYGIEDAIALASLIEATKRHVAERGRG